MASLALPSACCTSTSPLAFCALPWASSASSTCALAFARVLIVATSEKLTEVAGPRPSKTHGQELRAVMMHRWILEPGSPRRYIHICLKKSNVSKSQRAATTSSACDPVVMRQPAGSRR